MRKTRVGPRSVENAQAVLSGLPLLHCHRSLSRLSRACSCGAVVASMCHVPLLLLCLERAVSASAYLLSPLIATKRHRPGFGLGLLREVRDGPALHLPREALAPLQNAPWHDMSHMTPAAVPRHYSIANRCVSSTPRLFSSGTDQSPIRVAAVRIRYPSSHPAPPASCHATPD